MGQPETSESGSPIYRYGPREKKFELAHMEDSEAISKIEAHIERHVGKIGQVFHEIMSDLVHVDVHHVEPAEKRPFHTFITTGMSDRPMKVPKGLEDHRFAELLVVLPSDWPVPKEQGTMIPWKDEDAYWPIRWVKILARFPHEHETWLGLGHSMPNGDPPHPLSPGSAFSSVLLLPPVGLPSDFRELHVREDKLVRFYAVIPLTTEELKLKLDKGLDALTQLFDRHRVNELIQPARKPVVRRRWLGLF